MNVRNRFVWHADEVEITPAEDSESSAPNALVAKAAEDLWAAPAPDEIEALLAERRRLLESE